MSDITLPIGTIIKVTAGRVAVDQYGQDVTPEVPRHVVTRFAGAQEAALYKATSESHAQWKAVPMSMYEEAVAKQNAVVLPSNQDVEEPGVLGDIRKFIKNSYALKPKEVKIEELHWRFIIAQVVRGESVFVRGPSGNGKTLIGLTIAKVLNRPLFYFNLGDTLDPESVLKGNTHFSEGKTLLKPSEFIRAIQTPNAIVMLDELSRAHPAIYNLLLPLLDPKLRCIRLDADPDTPLIHVAEGVSFFCGANIGAEYTAARSIDRALMDRLMTIDLPHLSKMLEIELLTEMFPDLPPLMIQNVAEIATKTRSELQTASPALSTCVSTRSTIRIATQLDIGFTLAEAAEVCIYPLFSDAGGPTSERAFVKQLVQQYLTDVAGVTFASNPNVAKTPWS